MEFNVSLWSREESPLLEIPLPNNTVMKLSQYGSDDQRWGIHSCVWDGGLALLAYLHHHQHPLVNTSSMMGFSTSNKEEITTKPLIIDLGSGTGVTGIGAALLGYRAILTDLPEALPILLDNKRLNTRTSSRYLNEDIVHVMELCWGDQSLPPEFIHQIHTASISSRQIIITGADIIYRQNLFQPLLHTLKLLMGLLTSNITNPALNHEYTYCTNNNTNNNANSRTSNHENKPIQCRCILASQSTREHLHQFWKEAREYGFQLSLLANVTVPEGCTNVTSLLSKMDILPNDDNNTMIPPEEAVRKRGVVNIVSLSLSDYNLSSNTSST